ncbi:unnamed protein product [Paramecium primaurelia]|uniref:DnaJ domain n=1 Tax=Paramecium primaurelia TaxID=5886 RepID=A0A8S1KJ02_PARPR|nr:unnamed protein product [Paramecium primaurelia]
MQLKRDYYEILGLEQNCDQDQIKKAYRNMALKFHPDKNQADDAKEVFQEIQEAYQVLSDPNERTWYDNHKQQILNPDLDKADLETMEGFGFNIWHYFSPHYFGFGDDQQGFYAFYREAFEKIKFEEESAFNNKQLDSEEEDSNTEFEKLPGFGTSNTPIDQVLKFYVKWENFTTYKQFAYADKYNPKDAPNRWVKRAIIKDNKVERKEEKKKYLKTIKKLVETVKNKDPRYKEYLEQLKKEQIIKEQQKKKFKEQEKIHMQEILKQARLEEQERFKQNEEYFKERQQFQVITEKQEKSSDVFFCEICDKEFKSESQFKNHQNSKIHKSNLKDIISQITVDKREQEELLKKNGVNSVSSQDLEETQKQIQEQINKELEREQQKQQKLIEQQTKQKEKKKIKNKKKKSQQQQQQQDQKEEKNSSSDELQKETKNEENEYVNSDDDDHFTQLLKNKKNNPINQQQDIKQPIIIQQQNSEKQQSDSKFLIQQSESDDEKNVIQDTKKDVDEVANEPKQLNKAKLKKLKKKEKEKQNEQEKFKCNVCQEVFQSKTKLFKHLNESGHQKAK